LRELISTTSAASTSCGSNRLRTPDLASEVDARSFLPSHASLDLYTREASSSRKPSVST
jgi:hypothetical protein